jgi:hypothetical protein
LRCKTMMQLARQTGISGSGFLRVALKATACIKD